MDTVIYCDACLEGMGFWYPLIPELTAYYLPVLTGAPPQIIFYYEALCILSALLHGSYTLPSSSCILIFTDNSNTVDIFYILCALVAYNFILRSAVDILLDTNHQLQVRYVPSNQNDIADSISSVMLWPYVQACIFHLLNSLVYR